MPNKYNKVVDLTRVGYEYREGADYMRKMYTYNGWFHRTDGPALTYAYPDERVECFYIHGVQVLGSTLDLFKEIMVCSISELPKYINEPTFAPVVKERLLGSNQVQNPFRF